MSFAKFVGQAAVVLSSAFVTHAALAKEPPAACDSVLNTKVLAERLFWFGEDQWNPAYFTIMTNDDLDAVKEEIREKWEPLYTDRTKEFFDDLADAAEDGDDVNWNFYVNPDKVHFALIPVFEKLRDSGLTEGSVEEFRQLGEDAMEAYLNKSIAFVEAAKSDDVEPICPIKTGEVSPVIELR